MHCRCYHVVRGSARALRRFHGRFHGCFRNLGIAELENFLIKWGHPDPNLSNLPTSIPRWVPGCSCVYLCRRRGCLGYFANRHWITTDATAVQAMMNGSETAEGGYQFRCPDCGEQYQQFASQLRQTSSSSTCLRLSFTHLAVRHCAFRRLALDVWHFVFTAAGVERNRIHELRPNK